MKIAIASGKGGTGKTTIATNLALSLGRHGRSVALLDCDVEEPNCHLFLNPVFDTRTPVTVPVPQVDQDRCTACGICAEVCEYNAIARLGETVLVFEHLCHGCGGCQRFCPEHAITEVGREVGVVESGTASGISFVHGKLRVGEVMSPPVIRAVRAGGVEAEVQIIDAPPGTSCPVITSVRGADFVVLVTEPTPFGLNDLTLAVEMIRMLGLPFGVALNRSDLGDSAVQEYCAREGIEVVLEIPNDRRIAEAYSRGELAVDALPEYEGVFLRLFDRICPGAETPVALKVTEGNQR